MAYRVQMPLPLQRPIMVGGFVIEAWPVQHSLNAPAVGFKVSARDGCLFRSGGVARAIFTHCGSDVVRGARGTASGTGSRESSRRTSDTMQSGLPQNGGTVAGSLDDERALAPGGSRRCAAQTSAPVGNSGCLTGGG
jgi:hypothetical protein